MTLPARGAYGEDSLGFSGNASRTFAESTLVRVEGTGSVTRTWKQFNFTTLNGSAGQSYTPLDAAGDWWGSSCPGSTAAYFWHPIAGGSGRELCVNRPLSAPRGGPHVRVQTVWGWLMLQRSRAREPIVNGQYECGPLNLGPCFNYGGVTTVRITPWREFLTLTATPARVVEGDTVRFVASAPQGITVRRWIWVPDVTPPMAVRSEDGMDEVTPALRMTTVAACGTLPECRIPVIERGTMYVQARVNAPWQRRVEQASVRVEVDTLALALSCLPSNGERTFTTTCTASTQPVVRPFQPQSWTFLPDSVVLGPTTRAVDVSNLTWAGRVVTSGVARVSATINGRLRVASATLGVMRRSAWNTMVVADTGADVSPYPAFPRPDSAHKLGRSSFEANIDLGAGGAVGDNGPNEGLSYFTRLPFWVRVEYGYNSIAVASNSEFYNHQYPARTVAGGLLYCGRADVVPGMRDLVYAHEGTSRAAAGSHYQSFLHEFERLSRLEGESVVWREAGPYATLQSRWLSKAETVSNLVTHDPSNLDRLQQSLGCTIRLFPLGG